LQINVYLLYKGLIGWQRGSVVRTSVFGWRTLLIYAWSMVDMWPLRR